MAKDFSKVNTENIYSSTIAEATQEAPKTRKERRTYNAQETAEYMNDRRTTGRKGMHLPRINIAFTPDVYDYVKVMSKATGMSYTEFVNKILSDHKDSHGELYARAVEIRNSL